MKIIAQQSKENHLDSNIIDAIYDLNIDDYDLEWIKSTIETRIKYNHLNKSVTDMITYLKSIVVSNDNIDEVQQKTLSMINKGTSLAFDSNFNGSNFFDPKSHIITEQKRFKSGYNYIDMVLGGGYTTQSLIVFAGIPKVGKSLFLSNMAVEGSKLSYNIAYITLELSENRVVRRIASNLLNIKVKDYDDICKDENQIKILLDEYYNNSMPKPGNIIVKEFPTAFATAFDIENWLKQIELYEKMKFDIVIIDYIGIMKDARSPNNSDMYTKLKNISEDVRGMAMRNNWCILTASQLNRQAYNSNDVVIEHIAESGGLIHTVDCLFGIIQDPMLYMNGEYYLKTLVNRDEGYKNSKKKFKDRL